MTDRLNRSRKEPVQRIKCLIYLHRVARRMPANFERTDCKFYGPRFIAVFR